MVLSTHYTHCLDCYVRTSSHLHAAAGTMSYQPYSRGRCRPPILSSPAHIPAWTHGTALSVTGELRKRQAIFDVYIQDGLCWIYLTFGRCRVQMLVSTDSLFMFK